MGFPGPLTIVFCRKCRRIRRIYAAGTGLISARWQHFLKALTFGKGAEELLVYPRLYSGISDGNGPQEPFTLEVSVAKLGV